MYQVNDSDEIKESHENYKTICLNDQSVDYSLGEVVILCYERLEQLKKKDYYELELWIDVIYETGFFIRLNIYDIYNIIEKSKSNWIKKLFGNKKPEWNEGIVEKKALKYIGDKIALRFKNKSL